MIFGESLRDELMAAARRPPRRSKTRLAGPAVVVILALATAVALVDPGTAAAHVEVTHDDGRVVVRLTDREITPAEIEAATDDEGLDIQVDEVPSGPSNVGRFVGDAATEEGVVDLERIDLEGVTYSAFSLPEGWSGRLTLLLGRPAEPGEPYRVASDAYAPGEPLACSATLGRPLSELRALVAGFSVRVQAFDGERADPPMSFEDAIAAGLGIERVTGAIFTSATMMLVDVGRARPPADAAPC